MFVHLHVHTPYSFLDGASTLETLVQRAADLGMPALAITDHDNVCAAVKFFTLCRKYEIQPILGAEVTMEDATHLTLLARNRTGYANLCRLLTLSYAQGSRLAPRLPWSALPKHVPGLLCLSGCRRGRIPWLVRQRRYAAALEMATALRDQFGEDGFFIELQDDLTPGARRSCEELAQLAEQLSMQTVATNNVHHAAREEYITWDVLRCIGTLTPADRPHPDRPLNAERYLKSAPEMQALFAWCPKAIAGTLQIVAMCEAALPCREEITPRYAVPGAHADGPAYLRHLAYKGAKARYGPLTSAVTARLEHELSVIYAMEYADYFLMVWKIVHWARRQGIRCTGRGSAADSCVAYSLFLTDVDVVTRNLPFARFLTQGKTPDIDMDFPADQRDRVFRYILQQYGEDHVGSVCVFHCYWARSAVRDIGKVLGIPAATLEMTSSYLTGFDRADRLEEAFERPELQPLAHYQERLKLLSRLCARIAGFPRHLGTHSSGIVISRVPLETIAPLQPSARGLTRIWQLDKDDAETVGAIKFDVLSLRTLAALEDAQGDIQRTYEGFHHNRIPPKDAATYEMMQAGKAIGSFQFESAAQLSLAVTLEPRQFEDLVAAVALIRPGPVRGNVVNRFVGCRNGWLLADLLHPCLQPFLAKTYGCIVFQEQVNDVVAAMTGCTDAEADRFRKDLAQHSKRATMDQARADFVRRACAHRTDFTEERAHLLFDMIEGWGGYGFTEGHAASFALIGYQTAYLSVHHPAEFFAGLLNHQPMGYYNANSLVAEARRRGVRILPADINGSQELCRAEEGCLRAGLNLISGLRAEDRTAIVETRTAGGPFRSLLDFCLRVPLHHDRLENLILSGAFDSLHDHRRGLLWRLDETLGMARTYRTQAGGSQAALAWHHEAPGQTPLAWDLEDFTPWEKLQWEWRISGLVASCHPFAYLRDALSRKGVLTTYEAQRVPHGTRITAAGLNIRPHRPPTRSGERVLFLSLEDETDVLQAVVTGEPLRFCTATLLTSATVLLRGTISRRGRGASLCVEKAKPLRAAEFLTPSTLPPTTSSLPAGSLPPREGPAPDGSQLQSRSQERSLSHSGVGSKQPGSARCS